MDLVEVKHDFEYEAGLQCRLCLSIGRKLAPLGDLTNIYIKIIEDILVSHDSYNFINTGVCWECRSLLRKVLKFQKQVTKAQDLLANGQSYVYGPLSNLTSITLNDKKHTVYLNDHNTKVNTDNLYYMENKSNNNIIYEKYEELENVMKEDEKDIRINELEFANSQNLQNELKLKDLLEIERKIGEPDLNLIKNEFKSTHTSQNATFEQDCKSNFDADDFCLDKDQKPKSKNTWAQKRVAQNRKPKFKITTIGFDDVFTQRHLSADTENDYKQCKLCEATILEGNEMCHYKEHELALQCLKCGLKFGNRRKFYAHYKEWHEKYICEHCGVCFKMRYSIKKHIRKQHSPLICQVCNKTFKTYSGLWRHKKLVHTPVASPAYCVECDKSYKDIYRYKWHLCNSVKHAPKKKKLNIPCTECEKTFTKKIYMTEHYNLVHLKIFKYRCQECNKNFIRNADLMKHKRRIHEGILPPKDKICCICGRGFSTNRMLNNHQRTHSKERGFIRQHTNEGVK